MLKNMNHSLKLAEISAQYDKSNEQIQKRIEKFNNISYIELYPNEKHLASVSEKNSYISIGFIDETNENKNPYFKLKNNFIDASKINTILIDNPKNLNFQNEEKNIEMVPMEEIFRKKRKSDSRITVSFIENEQDKSVSIIKKEHGKLME